MHVFNCRRLSIAAALWAVTLIACSDESDPEPRILSVAREATSTECANGGAVVESGLDSNNNAMLEAGEIDAATTQIVCDGADGTPGGLGPDGLNAVVRTAPEAAGGNCTEGGVRIDVGLDDNGDGQLADPEIDATEYVCNQPAGMDGADYLVNTSPATTEECENSGVLISSGLDVDLDDQLDPNEVQLTRVLCAAEDGFDRLIEFAAEPAGTPCPTGGQRVIEGTDLNRDGTLQPNEIESVTPICTPVAGFIRTSSVAAGTDCTLGGERIERGLDTNGNGQLDPAEVNDTTLLCATGDGLASLVETSTVTDGNCPQGGSRLDAGLDENDDGVLDPDEIVSTSFACNAAAANGRGNSAVAIRDEPAGDNCLLGGVRIDTGPDTNGDGQLDDSDASDEAVNTTYLCNPSEGLLNLVEIEPELPGENCLEGGQRVVSGIDDDADGLLQPAEIDETRFVCSAVAAVPVAIVTPADLGTALAGEILDITIEAIGGLGGYSWQLIDGPPGISIGQGTPSAQLTGTVTSTGTLTIEVVVFDISGAAATRTFSLVADEPCGPGSFGAIVRTATEITVAAPTFSTLVRGMAADEDPNGWIYYVEPNNGVSRFRKDGTVHELDLQDRIDGLESSIIGYDVEVAGPNIYLTNDSTSCTTNCVYRVSNDGGVSFSFEDIGDFSADPPNDDFRGIHVAGTTMYVITHDAAATQLWSLDLSGAFPTPATLLATFGDFEYCSGLNGDSTYLYTVCDDTDGDTTSSQVQGVARIDLTSLTVERIVEAPSLTVSTAMYSSVYGQDLDDDGLFDLLYVTGDSGTDAYVCRPSAAATADAFAEEWLTDFSGEDEGMAYDPVTNSLYKVGESSATAVRFD